MLTDHPPGSRHCTEPPLLGHHEVLAPDSLWALLLGPQWHRTGNCTHYYFPPLCGVCILSLNSCLATVGKAGTRLSLSCVNHILPDIVGLSVGNLLTLWLPKQ